MKPVKIGIGGPVGAGKTQLIEKVVKQLSKDKSIGVITNDIYTKEDEKFLSQQVFYLKIVSLALRPEAARTLPSVKMPL